MGFRNYKYNNINNENCNYYSTNRDNGNIGIEASFSMVMSKNFHNTQMTPLLPLTVLKRLSMLLLIL